jgi:exonuclease III
MAIVLSWNVAGRLALQPRQASVLVRRDVDLVCLQEVTPATAPLWSDALESIGLQVATSAIAPKPERARRLGVLIASTAALEPVAVGGLPWPERHLAVRTTVDGRATEVHCLHAPLSSKPDRIKVRTLERIFDLVRARDGVERIVAGDLNTPQYESREGVISTFARTRSGLLRPDRDERHDRAELALIAELPKMGWSDAFRSVHGYERRDRSWTYPSRPFGYRLDHILLSPGFRAKDCDYLHDWREQGLSDHAPIWADVEVRDMA